MATMLKARDRAKLRTWQEFTENVKASTPVDLSETSQAKRDRIARLEADPEEWFKYYFPKFAFATPTDFHKAATKRIVYCPLQEWYEVRLWSRELAKSTRTMMEVFFITLVGHPVEDVSLGGLAVDKNGKLTRSRKRNVLMISNSEDNAIRLLLPYKVNFECNNRIINDYGIQETVGSWESGEFVTKSGISFRALGAGQSPRGSRNQEIRPDLILFDDLDTDEDCRNPVIIKKRWDWIQEAAMATRSISKGTIVIFCGNRIAKDCCVVRATQYADHTDIVNIRDASGKSTWPSKNTEAMIDRVLSKLSYTAIQKEYYNNPIIEGTVFKEMAYKPARPLLEYSYMVCYTDPSYKDTSKNDFKATTLVGKWRDEFHVIKAFVAQTTVAAMIDWHYQMMDILVGKNPKFPLSSFSTVGAHPSDAVCYFFMEQVFMQDMFYTEFNKASQQRGKAVPISGDQRAKPEKFMRIEALLEPLNRNGKLFLNEDEKENPHMERLREQFLAFSPGSRVHDDGPDAVEGAVWMINNKEVITAVDSIQTFKRTRNAKKSW